MRTVGSRQWRGYEVLSRPLTVLGVERRFFLLAAILGAAVWNAANTLLGGLLMFAVLYVAGWFAWAHDENMVVVIRAAVRYGNRYDAGRLPEPAPYIVVTTRER